MDKLTFDDIGELVELSQFPLKDRYLEVGNEKQEPYYRFLYHLTHRALSYKLCLEIGVGWGLGSAHMCSLFTVVIGIDNHRDKSILIDGLIAAWPEYIFLNCNSDDPKAIKYVDAFVGKYGPLGLVFQDSSHHYEDSCQEWDNYSQFLDENAIWICDDIMPNFYRPGQDPPGKGMVQYFEERPGEKKLYDNLHYGSAIGVILT